MEIRTLGTVALLIIVLFGSFLIRIQSSANIPAGQLTDPDGYFYYWQAQTILENGKLPARDMRRWVPLGRDLGQTLNLYPYVLAYTHKVLSQVFPNISLYHVVFYMPALCFCIGLGALYLFLAYTFDLRAAGIVAIFLVTLPACIERSCAGVGDRDSWCLMLGLLAVITYLAALRVERPASRTRWTLANGFILFLGGISWEGFGVFLSIILCVEIWRFITSETETDLRYYLIWVCTFVPTLYIASPAYRSGYGFAKHLSAFMLVPPLIFLGIRVLRYILITKTPWAEKLKPHSRSVALGLTLASIALALGYVLIQRNTFGSTTVPMSQNELMQTVAELKNPFLEYWMFRYGSIFVLGYCGIVMAAIRFWKTRGVLLAVPLTLFTITTFYRSRLDSLWGTATGNLLFSAAIVTCIIGFVVLAWRRQRTPENESTYIAFALWFLFWSALTRDAKRYDFFIGMSVAFFASDLICFLADFYGNQIKKRVPQRLLKTAIPTVMLGIILFWTPAGGHATRTLLAATYFRQAIPGDSAETRAFDWIKINLPDTAVVAANWSFGSLLNVLSNVKTIVDQDHYIQYWIHLYNQHIYFAESEREALEFLKTHNATHVMLTTEREPSNTFLHGQLSNAFVPVYPTENFAAAEVKVWEIHYASDIQSHPKYLATMPKK
ncbi:hypothetical protein C6503_16595 [Candidatus Poribacteria bacterium]|nr:MAG: hypothetical protein C6503_16595 [Candidatus Poribacteria bacterium]